MKPKLVLCIVVTSVFLVFPALVPKAIAGEQGGAANQNTNQSYKRGQDRFWCKAGVGITPLSSRKLTKFFLGRRDAWARSLSLFDLQARQGITTPTNLRKFLRFARRQAERWTSEEKAGWWERIDELDEHLVGLNVRLPFTFISKTSGQEEFGFAYTRNRTVFFPEGAANLPNDDPERAYKLLAHEYFHIASRFDRSMRDALYGLIGFHRVENAEFPVEFEDRKLTNPDAFRYEHAILVEPTSGGSVWVIPILQSRLPIEEIIQLPNALSAIDIVLMAVNMKTGDAIRDMNGDLVLYNPGNTDYVPQLLRNTTFIIAPDEILADNFSLLMQWRKNGVLPPDNNGFPINDQGLLESIETVLSSDCSDDKRHH